MFKMNLVKGCGCIGLKHASLFIGTFNIVISLAMVIFGIVYMKGVGNGYPSLNKGSFLLIHYKITIAEIVTVMFSSFVNAVFSILLIEGVVNGRQGTIKVHIIQQWIYIIFEYVAVAVFFIANVEYYPMAANLDLAICLPLYVLFTIELYFLIVVISYYNVLVSDQTRRTDAVEELQQPRQIPTETDCHPLRHISAPGASQQSQQCTVCAGGQQPQPFSTGTRFQQPQQYTAVPVPQHLVPSNYICPQPPVVHNAFPTSPEPDYPPAYLPYENKL